MKIENILLDSVKEICGIPSDNALAIKLDIQRQAISKIRRGEMSLPDARIAELCNMANLDGPLWLAQIHAERATDQVERAMWKTALDRLSAAAAVVALVSVLGGLQAAETAYKSAAYASEKWHSLYIM